MFNMLIKQCVIDSYISTAAVVGHLMKMATRSGRAHLCYELEGFDGVRLIDRRGSDMELRVHNTLNTVTAQWRKV